MVQERVHPQALRMLSSLNIPCSTCRHIQNHDVPHPNGVTLQCHRWGPIQKVITYIMFGVPETVPICKSWEQRTEKKEENKWDL